MALFAKIRAQISEHGGSWLRQFVAVLVLCLIFFVAFGGVSHNARWKIYNINVAGSAMVSGDDIREFVQSKILGNYYYVYARDNSFIFPKRDIEMKLLEKFPRLETALVTRSGEHTISVVVTERKPYVLWCGDEQHLEKSSLPQCWFVDLRGFIFDRAPIFSRGVYLEVYGKLEGVNGDSPIGRMLPTFRFSRQDALVRALRVSIGEPLRVVLKPEGEFEIVMRTGLRYSMISGVTLKFRDEMVPATIVKNLNSALDKQFPDGVELKKKLQYIDLRFGNKIFFGFEN